MYLEIITSIGALLSGGFITHLFLNKKYKAEAQATVSNEALKLVQALQQEVQIVKQEVTELRKENIVMHRTIAILETEKATLQGRVEHLETELARHQK